MVHFSKELKGILAGTLVVIVTAIFLVVPRQFVSAIADERIEQSDKVDQKIEARVQRHSKIAMVRISDVEKKASGQETKIAVLETRLEAIVANLAVIGADVKTLIKRSQ